MGCDAANGEVVTEHPIPEPGIKHVGYVRYTRRLSTLTPDLDVSPMS